MEGLIKGRAELIEKIPGDEEVNWINICSQR
jgi:hypothetical protein